MARVGVPEMRLSTRAVRFLDSGGGPATAPHARDVHVDVGKIRGPVDREAVDSLTARLDEINLAYGGLEFTVADGALAGRIGVGSAPSPRAWRYAHQEYALRVARHDVLQCALALSSTGRIGSSWDFDFWPLFDSMEHVIENAAMWNEVRGWSFVAVAECPPEVILSQLAETPLALDETASGDLAQWWFSRECAVCVERFLNPNRSNLPQVSVLARTNSAGAHVKSLLQGLASDPRVHVVTERQRIVGGGGRGT